MILVRYVSVSEGYELFDVVNRDRNNCQRKLKVDGCMICYVGARFHWDAIIARLCLDYFNLQDYLQNNKYIRLLTQYIASA